MRYTSLGLFVAAAVLCFGTLVTAQEWNVIEGHGLKGRATGKPPFSFKRSGAQDAEEFVDLCRDRCESGEADGRRGECGGFVVVYRDNNKTKPQVCRWKTKDQQLSDAPKKDYHVLIRDSGSVADEPEAEKFDVYSQVIKDTQSLRRALEGRSRSWRALRDDVNARYRSYVEADAAEIEAGFFDDYEAPTYDFPESWDLPIDPKTYEVMLQKLIRVNHNYTTLPPNFGFMHEWLLEQYDNRFREDDRGPNRDFAKGMAKSHQSIEEFNNQWVTVLGDFGKRIEEGRNQGGHGMVGFYGADSDEDVTIADDAVLEQLKGGVTSALKGIDIDDSRVLNGISPAEFFNWNLSKGSSSEGREKKKGKKKRSNRRRAEEEQEVPDSAEKIPEGWMTYDLGNIVHGPGSYYINDGSITLRFEDIQSNEEAWKKIWELRDNDPNNPPVMWQHTDPWDRRPGHLVVHLLKFFYQELDADTGKIVEEIPEMTMLNWQGKPHPEGNLVYHLAASPEVDTYEEEPVEEDVLSEEEWFSYLVIVVNNSFTDFKMAQLSNALHEFEKFLVAAKDGNAQGADGSSSK